MNCNERIKQIEEDINLSKVLTPCFIVHEGLLEDNLKILDSVQKATDCKILLALKGFAMYSTFPVARKYLYGVCASSPDEARLGREEFGREVHSFAPAYSEEDMEKLLKYSDHIIFNSISQWKKYKPKIDGYNKKNKGKNGKQIECGLRINPEYSEIKVALYNPCTANSRFGILAKDLEDVDMEGISGLHFHVMCEQGSDTLKRVLEHFEKRFGKYIKENKNIKWVNFGGGHHITREGYDLKLLCNLVKGFKERYDVQVYLEPGEAIGLNTGILVASVLDIVNNGMDIAILDTSAEDHMPDVLAMPYRPEIIGAGKSKEYDHTYRLGGVTCLAGDVIGDYSFKQQLKIGDKIAFLDMAHYSMVKTTTFNGIQLPSIALYDPIKKRIRIVKKFGYEDYKRRL